MDTTTPLTLFERTSGGRFMDISLRYDMKDILEMRRVPFRTCHCCKGEGVHLSIIVVTRIPCGVSARTCDTCEGTGLVPYECYN